MFALWLALSWIPIAFYTAKVAQAKGCRTMPWFIGGLLFGPVALLAAAGWPDRWMRRYVQLLAEEQGVARDDLLGRQLARPKKIEPRDPNKPKGLLNRLDDVMDPDRG